MTIGVSWLPPPPRPIDASGPSRPFSPLPDDLVDRPVFATFREVARRRRGAIALSDVSAQLSYAQLHNGAVRLARRIREGGDGPIAILLPNAVGYAAAMLACLAAGRPYLALDMNQPALSNARIVADAGLAGLIVLPDGEAGFPLPEGVRRIPLEPFGDAGDALLDHDPAWLAPVLDPACILCTSGSTGQPKGIVNHQAALLQRVVQYANASHADASDVFLPMSALATISGTREALAALLLGGRLCVADPRGLGLSGVLAMIRDAGVTMIYAVPALFAALVSASSEAGAFASVRNLRLGGDRIMAEDVALARAVLPPSCLLQIGYSSTESTGTQWFVPPGFDAGTPALPVGYALPGIDIALVDDGGAAVPRGEVGELLIRSRYVAMGEWRGRVVETPGILPDPDDPGRRILRTGDHARLGEDALIEFVGRSDRRLKINGQRVELGEIDAALRSADGVRDAAVAVRRVGRWKVVIVAAVVCDDPGAPGFEARLRARLRASLPAHAQPSRLRLVDRIPRLAGGKVDQNGVLALFAPGA